MPLLVIIPFFFLEEVCNSSIFLAWHVESRAAKRHRQTFPRVPAQRGSEAQGKPLLLGQLVCAVAGYTDPKHAQEHGRPLQQRVWWVDNDFSCSLSLREKHGKWLTDSAVCSTNVGLQNLQRTFSFSLSFNRMSSLSAEEHLAQTIAHFGRPSFLSPCNRKDTFWYDFSFSCNSLISVTLWGSLWPRLRGELSRAWRLRHNRAGTFLFCGVQRSLPFHRLAPNTVMFPWMLVTNSGKQG